MPMKSFAFLVALSAGAISLTACTATEQGAAVGGVTGAAIGGATTGTTQGALIGGAIGATAGALIGKASEPGECYYRDRYGRRYIAACPA